MKQFISLMNKQSFYYLWQTPKTRGYLLSLVRKVTKTKDGYELYDAFNHDTNNVKSYIFLEGQNNFIFIDFNYVPERNKVELNKSIMKYLKLISNKPVIMLIFNRFKGENTEDDSCYQIYQNSSNVSETKLLLAEDYEEQLMNDSYGVTDYLYSLGEEFERKYLKEQTREENIYNLFKL